jgi:hypothetical protein
MEKFSLCSKFGCVMLLCGCWTAGRHSHLLLSHAVAQQATGRTTAEATSDRNLNGQWSLDLPNDEAGWLSIREEAGRLAAELMWGVGSAKPIEVEQSDEHTLQFVRTLRMPHQLPDTTTNESTKPSRFLVTVRARGDVLTCTMRPADSRADEGASIHFLGRRQPPIPAQPNLAQVQFGEPIALFNGRNLAGWRPSNPDKKNGWSVRQGVLCNDTPKTDFSAYGDYANLRTDEEFNDFALHIEYRLPHDTGGNSGVYLRGMYEVQVTHRDSKMQGINGPGAVFGRIEPSRNAGQPAGSWETLDILLVDRHVSVRLNDQLVIDNRPVEGCTGGALLSDVTQPGPIYLQGDHTSVEYRNIVLRPRVAN